MKVTATELAEWVVLYDAGHSLCAISDQTGRDRKVISAAFRRNDIEIRTNQPHTRQRHGWCDECCEEKPLNTRTGWCQECSNRLQNGRIGPGRVNGPALVATSVERQP